MTVWSIGSPSGFTGRLFHTITCAQSRRDSHTANHIMCGVWNRQWGDPLGDKPGHQASRYLPWWKWHQKQNMTWDFIISTSGIQGDFWYINHGCRQDNSWKNQLVTNFFHLHYKILSNALGLLVVISVLGICYWLTLSNISQKIYTHHFIFSTETKKYMINNYQEHFINQDDIMTWKRFPHYWPIVMGTHCSPVWCWSFKIWNIHDI